MVFFPVAKKHHTDTKLKKVPKKNLETKISASLFTREKSPRSCGWCGISRIILVSEKEGEETTS